MEENYTETYLSKWLAGEISDEQLKEYCSEEEIENYKKLIQQTDALSVPKMDSEAVFAKIQQRKAGRGRIARRRIMLYAVAASVLVVLAFAGIQLFLPQGTTVKTAYAEMQQVELPDGSTVHMNHASKIQFKEKGFDQKRVVKLEGEAFFDVVPGASFVVQTGQGTVEVLGTSFNIYARDKQFETECYTGRIRVNPDVVTQNFEITSGQKIICNASTAQQSQFETNSSDWREGVSRFSSAPLERVLEELSFVFDVQIVNESRLGDQGFTGVFQHESLDGALDMVLPSLSLESEMNEDVIVIRDKN